MAADTQTREERLGLLDSPVERVVRHGVFWYHVPDYVIQGGEHKEVLVERMGFYGEKITLYRAADLERGEEHGAFFSDDELKTLQLPSVTGSTAEETPSVDADYLNSLDDGELVDWLMGAGEFDGDPKPNADTVVSAVGDDAALARRVIEADATAQGGSARKTVEEPLSRVANS